MGRNTEDSPQADWEGEGGTPQPEPEQKTATSHETPVLRRTSIFAAFKKIIAPVKKR
jgi:hypothetical protein